MLVKVEVGVQPHPLLGHPEFGGLWRGAETGQDRSLGVVLALGSAGRGLKAKKEPREESSCPGVTQHRCQPKVSVPHF